MIKNAKFKTINKNNTKKHKLLLIFAFFILFCFVTVLYKINAKPLVFAEGEDENIASQETIESLETQTNKQLDDLDLDEIENQLANLGQESYSIFDNLTFKEVVSKIVSGEFEVGFGAVFNGIKDGVISSFKHVFSLLLVCVAICLMFAFYKEFISGSKINILSVVRLVFFAIASAILASVSASVIKKCNKCSFKYANTNECYFPNYYNADECKWWGGFG